MIPFHTCWEWRGAKDKDGYGKFTRKIPKTRKSTHHRAHRAAYTVFKGPIEEGMHVLHSCDNTSCCNPQHLFLGTNKDNMVDKIAKGRSNNPKGADHWTKRKPQVRNDKGRFSK